MAARKPKASELSYHGTEGKGDRSIAAAHEGRVVGFLKSSMTPVGRKLDMAWVDPKYQRRGIGSTMVGLEKHRSGHMPIGDEALSVKGAAFQRGIGVPKNSKGEVVGLPASAFPPSVSETIQGKQGHLLREEQFDPKLVNAVAPYKAPRRKKEPAPVQGELFSGADYEKPKATVARQGGGKFASRKMSLEGRRGPMGKFDADPPWRGGEYLNIPDRPGMVDIPGFGRYDAAGGEIEASIPVHRDEGDIKGAATLSHLQGMLFDPYTHERDVRTSLVGERFKGSPLMTEAVGTAIGESSIPSSHLQARPPRPRTPGERPETTVAAGSGFYGPERIKSVRDEATRTFSPQFKTGDVVSFDPREKSYGRDWKSTAVHELGHRHHFSQFPTTSDTGLTNTTGRPADPLTEAHADAYVDRYMPRSGQARKDTTFYDEETDEEKPAPRYSTFAHTGYGTDFRGDSYRGPGWTPAGAALYAGARAHFGETGEIVRYQRNVRNQHGRMTAPRAPQEVSPLQGNVTKGMRQRDPAVDATLAVLMEHSPHARQAVADTSRTEKNKKPGTAADYSDDYTTTPLGPEADKAVRRHKDRQLLRGGQYVQENLFGEEHMSRNQFGETPRTVAQVKKSLQIKKGASFEGTGLT